jgi:hypothetical protein
MSGSVRRNPATITRRMLLPILVMLTMLGGMLAAIAPAALAGAPYSCTVTGPDVSCPTGSGGNGNGNYFAYPGITTSNGWGTYIANNCLDDGACVGQKLEANNYNDWQVTANEPAGNGSVMVGPELQNQTNDWCAADKQWDSTLQFGCSSGSETDTPIASVSSWTSSVTDYIPHNSQTIAEGAWDIWTNYTADIMVWNDIVGRCNPGSFGQTVLGTGVQIGGHTYDVRRYGDVGGEIIFTEEGPGGVGTCAQDSSETIDLLGILNWVQSHGIVSNITVGLADYTFEICSTGGSPETFGVSSFTMPTVAGTNGGGGAIAPAVTTDAASNVSGASATLNGSVNPEGQATTYKFDYGTTTSYGTSVPSPDGSAGSGSTAVNESASLTGLTAGTTYHYRIEATNATGTTLGADQQFTTGAAGSVAVDSSGHGGKENSATLSWTQQVSGSNRAILASVAVGGNSSQTVTVKDNGIAMTAETGKLNANNQQSGFERVFGLVNPPAGTNTITVTSSGQTPQSLAGGSVSFTNVSQSAPFGTAVHAAGSSATPSVTTSGSASGDLIAGFAVNGSAINSATAPESSQFIQNVDNNTAAGNVAGATTLSTGGNVTVSWASDNDWWAAAAIQVQHS